MWTKNSAVHRTYCFMGGIFFREILNNIIALIIAYNLRNIRSHQTKSYGCCPAAYSCRFRKSSNRGLEILSLKYSSLGSLLISVNERMAVASQSACGGWGASGNPAFSIKIDLIKFKYVMIYLYEYVKLAEKDFFYYRLNNKSFLNSNK